MRRRNGSIRMAKKPTPVKKAVVKKAAVRPMVAKKIMTEVRDPAPVVVPTGVGLDAKAMMRFESNKKSTGVAFLLWIFFSMLGGHRFYLGRPWSAVLMILLTITMFGAIITAIWALIDAFCIPGMVRDYNNRLADAIARGATEMLPTR